MNKKASQQLDMASMRRYLKAEFDDVQLTSFCLDYFPQVHEKFSQGMQRDEKIDLLFKYCRGYPNGLQRLLRWVEEWKKI